MFPRISTTLMTLMIVSLLALPALAVDLDTVALVDIVQGITITPTTTLNFGSVALNTGTISVATDGSFTETDALSFDATDVSQGVFAITAIASADYDISFLADPPAAGLTLDNFTINIDGGIDVVGASPFTAVTFPNAATTLNVGADLTVDAANASEGLNQTLGYTVTVIFN